LLYWPILMFGYYDRILTGRKTDLLICSLTDRLLMWYHLLSGPMFFIHSFLLFSIQWSVEVLEGDVRPRRRKNLVFLRWPMTSDDDWRGKSNYSHFYLFYFIRRPIFLRWLLFHRWYILHFYWLTDEPFPDIDWYWLFIWRHYSWYSIEELFGVRWLTLLTTILLVVFYLLTGVVLCLSLFDAFVNFLPCSFWPGGLVKKHWCCSHWVLFNQ